MIASDERTRKAAPDGGWIYSSGSSVEAGGRCYRLGWQCIKEVPGERQWRF